MLELILLCRLRYAVEPKISPGCHRNYRKHIAEPVLLILEARLQVIPVISTAHHTGKDYQHCAYQRQRNRRLYPRCALYAYYVYYPHYNQECRRNNYLAGIHIPSGHLIELADLHNARE